MTTLRDTTFRAWITKYALSTGITEVDASLSDRGVLSWKKNGYAQYSFGEGKDWHRTHAAAIECAKRMRDAKIISLRERIAKLEKMTFGETKP